MKTLFIIGSGTMGSGIAQVAALKGLCVTLYDLKPELVERGIRNISSACDKLVEKGKLEASLRDAALARITPSVRREDAAEADMVLEAAVENLDIKRQIFSDFDKIMKPDALLASNTSSLSITAMAAATSRPDKVIGMHFFNPVPRMDLVEVIRGAGTSDATYEATVALTRLMGKTPVTVHEYPGFVVNRLLIPMINEAAFLLQEGVATAEDIDTAMRLGANHPMGPLALGDLVGLDVCLAIMDLLHTELGEDKYRPAPMLRTLVRAGKLGRKTGQGFYSY